jgi:hypothetical protein
MATTTQQQGFSDVPEGPEGPYQDRPAGRPMGLDRFQKRNPEPQPEPALAMARTQAEWHQAQQALVDSQSPPEEIVIAQAEVEGLKPTEVHQERLNKRIEENAGKRVEQAKADLEAMRQGDFRSGGVGQSSLSPASTPGYVPAPVQGQTPPVPGQPQTRVGDHGEQHHLTAQAHRQAADIHQQEADANPAQQPAHARAAATHRQQAEMHETESKEMPGMHGVPAPDAPPPAAKEEPKKEKEKK